MSSLILKIEQDTDAEPPSEWLGGEYFRFFTNTPRNLGSINTKHEMSDFTYDEKNLSYIMGRIRRTLPGKGWVLYPVYAYIYSGIALSLSRTGYPFTCPWDSGLGGIMALHPEGKRGNLDVWKTAKSIIESYNQYFSGDVWGYIVETEDGDTLDSLWGMYGEDYAREEGEKALAYWTEKEAKEKAAYENSL